MRLILTGCNGSLGSNVARNWLLNPLPAHEVIKVSRTKSSGVDLACDLIYGDSIKTVLPKADCLVHMAAVTPKIAKTQEDYLANVQMANNLVRYSQQSQLKKLIFISTGDVYGRADRGTLENSLCQPTHAYGQSQLEAEKILVELEPQTSVTILRLFYPFGFDSQTKNHNFISKMGLLIRQGNLIKMGTVCKTQYFNPMFLDDFLMLLNWIIKTDWRGCLNAGGWHEVTLHDLVLGIGRYLRAEVKIDWDATMPPPLRANIEKMKSLPLDFEFTSWKLVLSQTAERLRKVV